ncbi:MAG: methyltransferase domain-containing protein [Thermodesulfobacteriota bacterium]
MLRRLIDILACPACGESLRVTVIEWRERGKAEVGTPGCEGYCALLGMELNSPERRREAHEKCPLCYTQEIWEGTLTCPSRHTFQILRAIPRFLFPEGRAGRTKQTFDSEWMDFSYDTRIYGHSPREELQDLFERTGMDEELLRGKRVLDAGCGMGRLCHTLSRTVMEIVGMDLSEGVEKARALNEDSPHVHIVQGDIMNLPFRKESFDCAYSKGVLHYVPDVPRCLASLGSRVKQGGVLSVSLYPRMSLLFRVFARRVRRVSVRLPMRFNFRLSHALIPLLPLVWRCSGLPRRQIDWGERAHMIFNWLSSPYQNSATGRELELWLTRVGFQAVRSGSIPLGITAVKTPSAHTPGPPVRDLSAIRGQLENRTAEYRIQNLECREED